MVRGQRKPKAQITLTASERRMSSFRYRVNDKVVARRSGSVWLETTDVAHALTKMLYCAGDPGELHAAFCVVYDGLQARTLTIADPFMRLYHLIGRTNGYQYEHQTEYAEAIADCKAYLDREETELRSATKRVLEREATNRKARRQLAIAA